MPRAKKDLDEIDRIWPGLDPSIFIEYKNTFLLRLQASLPNEKMHRRNLIQHGNIRLMGQFGSRRERLLGYILEWSAHPIIHPYTWFVALAYTDPADVRRKPLRYIYNDNNLRMARAGIGVESHGVEAFDYLLCFRGKTHYHDELDRSHGAVALRAAVMWKAGF